MAVGWASVGARSNHHRRTAASGLVTITYAASLTSTGTLLMPSAANQAYIDDGHGNVYTRLAFVNGRYVFVPLVLKSP